MLILGIESSCDETAVALVEDGTHVIHSLIASQIDVHALYGGIVPEIAAREHLKAIDPLYKKLISETKIDPTKIDLIAVTQGPGLIGALLVGISYAKGLAIRLNKPLIPVNHVEAHVHSALLSPPEPIERSKSIDSPVFPCIALVVSGGHTNLYYMKAPTHFSLLAYSQDDACGECFDKVAKLLGLRYPGGPQIEKLATQGTPNNVSMPRVLSPKAKMMFSYSGLKTHMVHMVDAFKKKLKVEEFEFKPFNDQYVFDLCAAFQDEAFSQLIRKLSLAIQEYPDVKNIIIAGGVAANKRFHALINKNLSIPVIWPHLKFCSDNAAMIACLGFHVYQQQRSDQENAKLYYSQDWDAFSRYRFE